MGFLNSNACSFYCLITFANPDTPYMFSENPEIRHPTIPDSGDAEHRNMPGLILLLLLAKKKKYRRSTSHEDYFDKDGIIKRHDKNHRTDGWL
jgi:hypothetical protein